MKDRITFNPQRQEVYQQVSYDAKALLDKRTKEEQSIAKDVPNQPFTTLLGRIVPGERQPFDLEQTQQGYVERANNIGLTGDSIPDLIAGHGPKLLRKNSITPDVVELALITGATLPEEGYDGGKVAKQKHEPPEKTVFRLGIGELAQGRDPRAFRASEMRDYLEALRVVEEEMDPHDPQYEAYTRDTRFVRGEADEADDLLFSPFLINKYQEITTENDDDSYALKFAKAQILLHNLSVVEPVKKPKHGMSEIPPKKEFTLEEAKKKIDYIRTKTFVYEFLEALQAATFTGEEVNRELKNAAATRRHVEVVEAEWMNLLPEDELKEIFQKSGDRAAADETIDGRTKEPKPYEDRLAPFFRLALDWGTDDSQILISTFDDTEKSGKTKKKKRKPEDRFIAVVFKETSTEGIPVESAIAASAKQDDAFFAWFGEQGVVNGQIETTWVDVFNKKGKDHAKSLGARKMLHRGDWENRALDALTQDRTKLPKSSKLMEDDGVTE